MNKIAFEEFKRLVDNSNSKGCELCKAELYLGWEPLTKDVDNVLELVGEFAESDKYINLNGYNEYHPDGTTYCSKDSPIALSYYPYHESMIRRCPACGAVCLSYTEHAAHAPQKRIRLVQSELITFPLTPPARDTSG